MSKTKSGKKRYSSAEKKAYWIGVGIAAERRGEANRLVDGYSRFLTVAKRQTSSRAGLKADRSKFNDIASKL